MKDCAPFIEAKRRDHINVGKEGHPSFKGLKLI